MAPTTIHLRAETKPLEYRSALTPSSARALRQHGYDVAVERSPERIFPDAEFEACGARLVERGCWVDAPAEHLVLGLKELPEGDEALVHTHIQFAHCYKQQAGWERVLRRFPRGGGTLYDLEFLTHPNGARVAAFGFTAGYAGAALALLAWSHRLIHPATPLPSASPYPNEDALIADIKSAIERARPYAKRAPRVFIIGALGRCGQGAVKMCKDAGLPDSDIIKWDMAETAKGGPFREIVESDIFVNCVYLTSSIPPFVTHESLASPHRNLSVVCDVSCDPNSPHNPVPIYDTWSSFSSPTLPVQVANGPPLSVIAIDHLPSLLPKEASERFSADLLPSLLLLDKRKEAPVWLGAEKLFHEKVKELGEDGGGLENAGLSEK